MFDSSSTTCKILQIINDVLTPHNAVLHLKVSFYNSKHIFDILYDKQYTVIKYYKLSMCEFILQLIVN